MKKKLAIFAVFTLLLAAVFAVNVLAVENAVCPCCGKESSQIDWQPWTLTEGGTNHTLTEDGHYYLTGDVTSIKSQVRIGDDTLTPAITLDLRGFTIASTQRVFGVYEGATLSIVDSVGGGEVRGAQVEEQQVGGVIRVNKDATLNLYGGTVIDGATSPHLAHGAVISTEGSGCTLNIAGGNVTGSAFAAQGGAIYASRKAVVNISAGTITGGTANTGGAIFLDNATLNITGGKIIGGKVTQDNATDEATAGCGGAIYAGSHSKVTINGGEIIGAKAYHGGAIALMSSDLEIISGSIQGSSVAGYGSVLHLLADAVNETPVPCNVTISGGEITSLQSSIRAAITLAANDHTLTITGGTITGAGKAGADGAAISGHGTAATVNISGGTITGVADSAIRGSSVVRSRGILNITGGTITVTEGNGPAVYKCDPYGELTITETTGTALSGKIRLVNDADISYGTAALEMVEGVTDGLWYYYGVEAVNNMPEGGFIRSFVGTTGRSILNLQGKQGVPIDVNGQVITVRNGSFYGFDTAGVNFKADKCGTITLKADDEYPATLLANSYNDPEGNRYVAVATTNETGTTYSFNRCDIALSGVLLRTTEKKEGMHFSSTIQVDASVISATKTYGIAITPYEMADDAAWTAAMDGRVQRSRYNGGLAAGKLTYIRSTSLVNILNINNENIVNNQNAETTIYVRPYVQLQDGSFVYGEVGQVTMKQVATLIDKNHYSTLTDTQKKGLLGMYERFYNVMRGWDLPNLKADYASGNPLILQYRREKVVANMQAQADVLWTFTGTEPIYYSREANSMGWKDDNSGNVYTLYPGRVYKGLPYTHGSNGLDIFDSLAILTDGVYVIGNMNSSLVSGGGFSSEYNMARFGNDCWDAVFSAYETVGSSVSANQTNQITPKYGMNPVGNYDINWFVNESGTLRYTTDAYAEHYAEGVTGYAENRQIMYEAYALMQAGDTLVHNIPAGGHAIMVVSVNVVRNEDGTINPDESTVTYLEQGSSHEKAQSKDFDLTTASGLQAAVNAGYDPDTGIWTLNPGQVTKTFTGLFDANNSNYIPLTSAELSDPTAKIPANRISDSVSDTSNVANIFAGKISSTYRVSSVTLDIYDANGEKVNSATCFGRYDGVSSPFNLARFVSDQTGAYGSVLAGTPKLVQVTDGTSTWLEAPSLSAGEYSFTMTCRLANGYEITFRSGSFHVEAGTNANGEEAFLVVVNGAVVTVPTTEQVQPSETAAPNGAAVFWCTVHS